jgi:DNA-directed RNA polymerase specialized sigma24 family protein
MNLTAKQSAILTAQRAHPEWSQRHLGAVLGLSQAAVCKLLARARKRLAAGAQPSADADARELAEELAA